MAMKRGGRLRGARGSAPDPRRLFYPPGAGSVKVDCGEAGRWGGLRDGRIDVVDEKDAVAGGEAAERDAGLNGAGIVLLDMDNAAGRRYWRFVVRKLHANLEA